MDKETLIRLATPASIFALALSIFTLPLTVKAYGDNVRISGSITVDEGSGTFGIKCYGGCNWPLIID